MYFVKFTTSPQRHMPGEKVADLQSLVPVYECILISKTFGWYQLIPSHLSKHQIIHLQCRNGEKSQPFIQWMSFLSPRTCDRVDINQLSWQFKKTPEEKSVRHSATKMQPIFRMCPMYAENWTAELCIIVTRPESGSPLTQQMYHRFIFGTLFWLHFHFHSVMVDV